MDQKTSKKLEDKGWKVGTVSDFLELSPEEAILVEIKLRPTPNRLRVSAHWRL
ncbi:MAG: hypothetical protein MJA27_06650 [Pseudanabaenales cyanobacterium]|nr:hypothetical protein [Pseudanabaenales cyanobacterium]